MIKKLPAVFLKTDKIKYFYGIEIVKVLKRRRLCVAIYRKGSWRVFLTQ